MFRKIIIGPEAFDPGSIIEALVFFRKVVLVERFGSLVDLVRAFDIDGLEELAKLDSLEIVIQKENYAVHTRNQKHNFVSLLLGGREDGRELSDEEMLFKALNRATERRGASKRAARRLVERVRFDFGPSGIAGHSSIPKIGQAKIVDNDFFQGIVPNILGAIAPDYPLARGCNYEVISTPEGLAISSDIDYNLLNRLISGNLSSYFSTISNENLMYIFISAINEFRISSTEQASINSNVASSVVINHLIRGTVPEQRERAADVKAFQKEITTHGKTIREAINNGERSLKEGLTLINESGKFREWSDSIGNDTSLIMEYISSINSIHQNSTLPDKILRLILSTTVGAINPIAGILASAADALLYDNISEEWQPNQFVNGRLIPFLE